MSIQEQLGQSQQPTAFPYALVLAGAVYAGVLGNQSVQIPPDELTASWERSIRGAEAPAFVATERTANSEEMSWLVDNVETLSEYKGEWLLIHGTDLLVHSRDFRDVLEAIRIREITSPFVYYVPTNDESNSVTI